MTKRKVTRQQIKRSEQKRKVRQAQERKDRIRTAIIAAIVVVVAGVALSQFLGSDGDASEPASVLPEQDLQEDTTTANDVEEEIARPMANIDVEQRIDYFTEQPEMQLDTDKEYEAIIRTERGNMRFRLFDDEAPITVNNFIFLIEQGYFDGTTFHRVIPDFMAQAGDPTATGFGGPGYTFEDEFESGLVFDRAGLLAMANSGPNTNGGQFFITFVPTPHLNGRHTIFGEIIEGTDVLNSITPVQPVAIGADPVGDLIQRIDVEER